MKRVLDAWWWRTGLRGGCGGVCDGGAGDCADVIAAGGLFAESGFCGDDCGCCLPATEETSASLELTMAEEMALLCALALWACAHAATHAGLLDSAFLALGSLASGVGAAPAPVGLEVMGVLAVAVVVSSLALLPRGPRPPAVLRRTGFAGSRCAS